MQTLDFFRSRIDAMINLNDPLAVLARRLPRGVIEKALAAKFERIARAGRAIEDQDLFGPTQARVGAGTSSAGRPRLPIRLMASLLYLKNSFNLSDEELCVRWSENVLWQFFSGLEYYEHRLPCDATQIGRFRRAIGEEGMELLLKATIDTAVQMKAVKPRDLERVIVDTTVQERIRTQQRHDKNKLYALHAPEVECIGKGKARKPYEFGVKSAIVVSHKHGLMLGSRSFPGNPYDGHILSAVLEQASNLMQDVAVTIQEVVADLGFRGREVDADNPDKLIIHRGRLKSLTPQQKGWLRRRQAIEPAIGHLKADHRMDRCWLQGALGDALHAISCAVGYNLRWLMRSVASLGLKAAFLRLLQGALLATSAIRACCAGRTRFQLSC